MHSDKALLLNALKEVGSIKRGVFRLSSGGVSDIYIDIRLVYSKPRCLAIIVRSMEKTLSKIVYDYICGIPTGGLPLASALAFKLNKPLIYVRKMPKEYGTQRIVEGIEGSLEGVKVVIVDDVITTGTSVMSAIRALRKLGARVDDVAVVVNRSKNKELLINEGIRLHSLLRIEEIRELIWRGQI